MAILSALSPVVAAVVLAPSAHASLPSQQLTFFDDTPGAVVYSIQLRGPNQNGDNVSVCVPTPGRTTQKASWWWSGRTTVDTFYSNNCTGAHATAPLWIDIDGRTPWRCLSDVSPYSDWSCPGATASAPGPTGAAESPVAATDIATRNFPALSGAALAQQCARDPNCTVADFAAMSPDDRITWLDAFQNMYDAGGWFNNVRGVLRAFRDEQTISGGNWYSYVDASTLEAINSGHAKAFGIKPRQELRGSAEWERFFRGRLSFASVNDQKAAWGRAEYAAIHGADANVLAHGIHRDPGATTFLQFGDLYRVAMQTGDTNALRDGTSTLFTTNGSKFTTGEYRTLIAVLNNEQLLNPTNETVTYLATRVALEDIASSGRP